MNISKFRYLHQMNQPQQQFKVAAPSRAESVGVGGAGSIDYTPSQRRLSREMSLGATTVAGHEHDYRGGVRTAKAYTDYLYRWGGIVVSWGLIGLWVL